MREMCKGQMESTRRSRIGGGRGTSSASPEQCHCIPKLLMSNRKILSAKHPEQNCSAPALYIKLYQYLVSMWKLYEVMPTKSEHRASPDVPKCQHQVFIL